MPQNSKFQGNISGNVSYSQNVIVSIISLATLEIFGVACLSGRKLVMETVNDTIDVDVFIDVKIGFSCSDIAFKVQENVKRSIETMTTLKTGEINVNVLGVSFDEK